MSLSLDLGFFGSPGGTLHELFTLHGLRGKDIFCASQASIQFLVFLNQKATLSLNLIVRERSLHFVGGVMIRRQNRGTVASLPQILLLNDPFKLGYFNCILVFHSSKFAQVGVLEDSVRLTEEIIN